VEVEVGTASLAAGRRSRRQRPGFDRGRTQAAHSTSLADAVGAATAVPAHRPPARSLSPPGADAGIVVLDDALEVRTVFVSGEA
jgi:hypothetical protein